MIGPSHGTGGVAVDGVRAEGRALVDHDDLDLARPACLSRSDSALIVWIAGRNFSPAVAPAETSSGVFSSSIADDADLDAR